MTDLVPVPPLVASVARAALAERDQRQGGGTRAAVLAALELSSAPVVPVARVREVYAFHAANADATTPDGRTSLLGGLWGGRPGRDWAVAALANGRTAAAPETQTGVMVALYPDAATAARLALPGFETPEQLHVTLGYLGNTDELDADALVAAAKVLEEVASRFPPLSGVVAGLGRFNAVANPGGGGELDALVALVDLPDLSEFRAAVARVLHDVGVPPRRDHGFSPHLTLSYLAPDQERPIENIDPVPLSFDALWWVVGEERTQLLLGGEGPVTAVTAAIADSLPIIRESSRVKRLNRRLRRIDEELRRKATAGAQVAMTEAMRQAKVKLKTRSRRSKAAAAAADSALECASINAAVLAAVGVTEAELLDRRFDSYADRFADWAEQANREKLEAIAEELGITLTARQHEEARRLAERGAEVAAVMLGMHARRLLTGDLDFGPEGEVPVDPTVPPSLLASAMAAAGGRQVAMGSGGAGPLGPGQVAVTDAGGLVSDVLGEAGIGSTELTWVWSGSERPFPPHEKLDGTTATYDTLTEAWGKDPSEFPEGLDHWWPGDHFFCGCRVVDQVVEAGLDGGGSTAVE